ncbi:MAG: NAD(P)-dependent oxidoreductase, partial [Candidatus Dadabacteria bacterium]|nr:NAD(P)-dependent oxidoreductase [Candidatus Dadabacteria bacterium]NIQ16963.1 NAD(P)-dependent oxidoreductase [Candidatus Dadabacteria bacterium]
AGYKVSVYNRTKSKALTLIDKGAVWKDSPAEVAKSSDVVFTIVGFPSDVRDVYFSDQG